MMGFLLVWCLLAVVIAPVFGALLRRSKGARYE